MEKEKKGKGRTAWKPVFLVHVYRYLLVGMTDTDIAKSLGVRRETFWAWKKTRADLKEVIALAEAQLADKDRFPRWVYSRLSDELKGLWDKIVNWEEGEEVSRGGGVSKIEALLADQGRRVRQQLFLHALCESHFSPSHALARVCVTRGELQEWIETDPGFAELVDEIQWHKGNYFEEALVQLVGAGVPAAVIFANKAYNASRGYGARLKVEHSGTVNHNVLDLAELMPYMSEACRLEVLEALRLRDRQREEERRPRKVPCITEVIEDQIAEGVP